MFFKRKEKKEVEVIEFEFLPCPVDTRVTAFAFRELAPQEEEIVYPVQISHTETGAAPQQLAFDLLLKSTAIGYKKLKWTMQKENFMLDGKAPELTMEQVNDQLAQLPYPVSIISGNEGQLRTIEIDPELYERWKTLRQKLQANFNGAAMQGILENADSIFSNKEKRQAVYENDLLLHLYFMGLQGVYYEGQKRAAKTWLPNLGGHKYPDTPMQFSTESELPLPIDAAAKTITVNITGQLDKEWWYAEGHSLWKAPQTSLPLVTLSGQADIEKDTGLLWSMQINIAIELAGWKKETNASINP